jgi:hypothetical protein
MCADGHLSPPWNQDGPRHRFRGCSRLSVSASHRQMPVWAACDRIGDCSREDCPFHPACRSRRSRFCCSRAVARVPTGIRRCGPALWDCQHLTNETLPRLSPGTLLCAARTFLWSAHSSGHPAQHPILPCQCAAARRAGAAQGLRRKVVPKEGFEPSRPYGHYALNVARLPIPPLRRVLEPTIGFEPMTCCLRNSCSAAELRRHHAAGILPCPTTARKQRSD